MCFQSIQSLSDDRGPAAVRPVWWAAAYFMGASWVGLWVFAERENMCREGAEGPADGARPETEREDI